MEELNKIKDRVEDILRNVPSTRNSDKELFVVYFKRYYGSGSIEDVLRSIPFESIRRTRQKIQQSGRYLSDVQVANMREDERQKYMVWLGYNL